MRPFSADGFQILVEEYPNIPVLPRVALESAIKIASEIVQALPKDRISPESTEGMQGFIHPVHIQGAVKNLRN
jgi:tripeptide aminopeptidase